MNKVPYKWKKHLMLVEFGLKREEDLNDEIKRYSKDDISALEQNLYESLKARNDRAYIVSLIPMTDYFKLPNYIVRNAEDLKNLRNFAESKKGSFSEIWYCEKERRNGIDNVVGRIALQTGLSMGREPMQTIEQVWSINHRDIEHYSLSSNINYLRASRDGWNRRYNLDKINIVNEDDRETILKDYVSVVRNIEQNRDKIENWLEYLKEIGISEIAIEYMLNRDKFKFIDWDTSDDKKVIDSVFKENDLSIER